MISSTDILHGKILIVDDQEPNVILLEQMLRGASYDRVSSTMDSTQVCELHLLNRYDLILLDLQMPGMDGFQVMENLKQIETGGYLPVLVVTAQADHKLRALKGGARDFLSKPFDLAEVLIRVYNLLEVRLLHLATLKLYDQVLAEQKVSRRLLEGVLPESLAQVLKGQGQTAAGSSPDLIADSFAEVTVLFSDLVAFTTFSEGASAQVMMGVLNDISARFHHPQERTRTLDDAYLATVGLTDAVADHSIRAANKALDLSEAVDRFNGHSRYQLKLSIGLEPGAADAKAPAKRKNRYDL
jgi:adenylate cyclase